MGQKHLSLCHQPAGRCGGHFGHCGQCSGTVCFSELLGSDNVVVRTKAAAYCLALRQDIEMGEHVLEEISRNDSYGIFRFNAEMTLKVWREKGELKLYQKKP